MIASNVLLLIVSIICATLYGLSSLIRAFRKQRTITFIDLVLVFMMALFPLVAVVSDNREDTQFSTIEIISTLIAIGIIIGGVVIALIELSRPQRLKQSRGMLGMGTGVLMLVMIFITFNIARVELQAEIADLPTPTAGATLTFEQLGEAMFTDILTLISDETGGLSPELIMEQLDSGVTLRKLITDNGGNVDNVVVGITDTMTGYFKQLAAEGRIETNQATAAIGSMGLIVRLALDRDFSGFLEQLENGGGGMNRTPAPQIQTERATSAQTATSTPTSIVTHTPNVSATPTLSATPSNTFTPTITRTPILLNTPVPLSTFLATATPTPNPDSTSTPTPTRVNSTPNIPCLAVMNFNVNLRETPTSDGRIIITIPFETTVFGIGRTSDSAWWQVVYGDLTGWVSDDVVTVTSTCRELPTEID